MIKMQFGADLVEKSCFGEFQHFFVATDLIDQFKESFLNRSVAIDF